MLFTNTRQNLVFSHIKMLRFAAIYLGNGLKLAVGVMDQVHQGTDGSRRVKVICQCLHHAGFSFSQPKTAKKITLKT